MVHREKRKRDDLAQQRIEKEVIVDVRAEHEAQKETTIEQLENTDIDKLRSACRKVLKRYPFVAKPKCGNPREWKNTLRSMVFLEIYGDEIA